jgi:hypothetical protein
VWSFSLKAVHRPWSISGLSEMLENLRFDATASSVAAEWVAREHSRTSLSCGQEKRLLDEEWSRQYSRGYAQPHRVMICDASRRAEPGAIKGALDSFISRHTALRAAFEPTSRPDLERQRRVAAAHHSGVSVSGLHSQTLAGRADVDVTSLHVSGTDLSVNAKQVFDLILADSSRSFDLAKPPLMRALVLESDSNQKLVALTTDHLIADWWSTGLALAECELCRPVTLGQPTPAAQPTARVLRRRVKGSLWRWRRDWQNGQRVPISCDDLACSLPPSIVNLASLACLMTCIPDDIASALRFADVSGDRLEVWLWTAFIVALHHATQQLNITVWTERRRLDLPPDTDRVGPFSHTLTVTADLSCARSIEDVVQCVRRSLSYLSANQEVPLDLLWRAAGTTWLPPAGSQVVFQHFNLPASRSGTGLIGPAWPLMSTGPSTGLQVRSCDDGTTLRLCAVYDENRLRREDVSDLLADLSDVLRLLVPSHAADRGVAGGPATMSGVTDYTLLSGEPAGCYLCACRIERRRLVSDRVALSTSAVGR